MRYAILAMALCIGGCGSRLAETLDEQVVRLLHEGKYAEAEPLALQALKVSLKKNGPDHPNTATSLNNLALLYDTQGKYGLAEPLYKRAIAILDSAFGERHPNTILLRKNLARMKAEREDAGT